MAFVISWPLFSRCWVCHELVAPKVLWDAVQKMEVGPPLSACRGR